MIQSSPKAKVRGSNPLGRANDISAIAVFCPYRLQRVSTKCPRNPFYSRSCRRMVAHVH
jgi:hypothetical protein